MLTAFQRSQPSQPSKLVWIVVTQLTSSQSTSRGFVLPIALLVIFLLALITSTILTRSIQRGNQAIGERALQSADASLSSAVDRSRAKLDYLMNSNTLAGRRLPATRPNTSLLASLLLDGRTVDGVTSEAPQTGRHLSFTLDDEVPLAVQPTAANVPAWLLDNGDTLTGYMILMNTRSPDGSLQLENNPTLQQKANNLMVRSLPFRAQQPTAGCEASGNVGIPVDAGGNWFFAADGSTNVKPIQVVAVTVPKDQAGQDSRAVSAVMFQQDRYRASLRDYAAYFRSDLEIFPGPEFNWNGKMYSESNIMIGDSTRFNGYLISSPDSCFYSPSTSSLISTPFEILAGSMKLNSFSGGAQIDVWGPTGRTERINFRSNNDSVAGVSSPAELAADPVILFTEGRSVPRYAVGNESLIGQYRDTNWESGNLATGGAAGEPRMLVGASDDNIPTPPYVDDTYRSDNRCGPNPNYGEAELPAGCINIGDTINTDPQYTTDGLLDVSDSTSTGLDGYWEKRANLEGTRIIVGQRLNLIKGHPFNPDLPIHVDPVIQNNGSGVLDTAVDPEVFSTVPLPNTLSTTLDQTDIEGMFGGESYPGGLTAPDSDSDDLSDNLDFSPRNQIVDSLEYAVQATALYHFTQGPDRPIACLNTVSDATGAPLVPANSSISDLVYVPPANAEINSLNRPFGRALVNLVNLSSDGDDRLAATNPSPNITEFANVWGSGATLGNGSFDPVAGAFPPFQETSEATSGANKAHPNPFLTGHGNFSELRRSLELLDGGITFSNLSIADKSTLHTAACTLGMLANEGDGTFLDFDGPDDRLGTFDDRSGLGPDGRPGGGDDDQPLLNETVFFNGDDSARLFGVNIRLNFGLDNIPGNNDDPIFQDPSFLPLQTFLRGPLGVYAAPNRPAFNVFFGPLNPDAVLNGGNGDGTLDRSECEAAAASQLDNFGLIDFTNHPIFGPDRIPCNADDYIVWAGSNGIWENGGGDDPSIGDALGVDTSDPLNPAVADTDAFRALIYSVLTGLDFQPGTSDDIDYLGGDGDFLTTGPDWLPNTADDIAATAVDDIVLFGFAGPNGFFGDYDDPNALRTIFAGFYDDMSSGAGPISALTLTTTTDATLTDLIQDVNVFNGRERMNVRTLQLDLGGMATYPVGGDRLFPESGVIYAFREDAVREDSVARPGRNFIVNGAPTSLPDYTKFDAYGDNNCDNARPNDNDIACIYINAFDGTDPLLTNANTTLEQDVMGGISPKPVDYYPDPTRRPYGFRLANGAALGRSGVGNAGLSFISENAVYVDGDFNLHTAEEFTDTLNSNFSNFYSRSTLNPNFAGGGTSDDWRPSEILADAITIVDNLDNAPIGMPGGANNVALRIPGVEARYGFRPGPRPDDGTRVNAILISGIVPSRAQQSYGGLHNFPRFIQDWGRDLFIQGSFIQLKFSTQGTAPFDQDAWPTESNPTPGTSSSEPIGYYGPPRRRWGYDIGLQYAPISPVAERFNLPNDARDEFVQDLEADDPYITSLQCAIAASSSEYSNPDCP